MHKKYANFRPKLQSSSGDRGMREGGRRERVGRQKGGEELQTERRERRDTVVWKPKKIK